MKGSDICPAFKAVYYKPYGNLQSLPIPIHQWKDLSINFVTSLPTSTNWNKDNYNSILVVVHCLIKMVHYKPVKITFDALRLAKVIINLVV